ncbi:MAG TPA: hypothetical protein VKU41_16565 [Polyangiaceae bacterium]|nr:hypothetical protein [Polyangiaceae bacterium]
MTPRILSLPRADDLHPAPELAVLALLEAAAYLASLSLGVAYPEIQALQEFDEPPELRQALAIMDAASATVAAISRYRLALVLAQERRDDRMPF